MTIAAGVAQSVLVYDYKLEDQGSISGRGKRFFL
jgi:hypothetical protein